MHSFLAHHRGAADRHTCRDAALPDVSGQRGGGPGGAYAFPGVREAQQAAAAAAAALTSAGGAAAGGGRAGGGPVLRLGSEPTSFSALAGAMSELSPRATAVLARVEWPGKPGARAPLPPLTPAEQDRFNAGREVYRNVCQACHQPDGRGRIESHQA
jgi:hypothetical protein